MGRTGSWQPCRDQHGQFEYKPAYSLDTQQLLTTIQMLKQSKNRAPQSKGGVWRGKCTSLATNRVSQRPPHRRPCQLPCKHCTAQQALLPRVQLPLTSCLPKQKQTCPFVCGYYMATCYAILLITYYVCTIGWLNHADGDAVLP